MKGFGIFEILNWGFGSFRLAVKLVLTFVAEFGSETIGDEFFEFEIFMSRALSFMDMSFELFMIVLFFVFGLKWACWVGVLITVRLVFGLSAE